jgi:dTDP-4-amino-4,6-dideoxygalactose transaminase
MTASIPFVDLKSQYARLKARIDARVSAVLDHGQFILGPEVEELESALAGFSGAGHAVGVSNGTDALIIALLAKGVGRGDAVFVPAFTFHATAEAVVAVGATPVFCDVHPRTFNLDPADLTRRIERTTAAGRWTPRAVIAVDLFGQPADYPALLSVAAKHDLFVLADAAQSFGGALGRTRVGRLAPVTATSFYPSKPLGAYGDAGAVLTDDADLAARLRSIRVHGKDGDETAVRFGLNARLDTLQAAILLVKLEALAGEIAAREAIARSYDEALAGLVETPTRLPGSVSAWAQYAILVDRRDAVARALADRGIPTRVYYQTPVHLHPAFAEFGDGRRSLPVAEALGGRVLCLPIHPDLDPTRLARVCAEVSRVVQRR